MKGRAQKEAVSGSTVTWTSRPEALKIHPRSPSWKEGRRVMVASPFVGVEAMAKRVRGPAPRKVVHFMTAPSRSCIASDAAVQRRPYGSAGRTIENAPGGEPYQH